MTALIVLLSSISVATVSMWPVFYAWGHRKGYQQAVAHGLRDKVMRKALGGDRFARSEGSPLVHLECGGGLWGKWEPVKVVQREPVVTRAGPILRETEVDGQKRTCDQCGFSEARKLTMLQ